MCDPTIAIAMSALGTGMSFIGGMQQARYQEKVAAQNAQLNARAAEDAIERGNRAETMRRLQTVQERGSAAASLAGQGFNVGSGSALTRQSDIGAMGDIEALTIRNNAAREAYQIRVQGHAQAAESAGQIAASKNNAMSSLISGAASTGMMAYKHGVFKSSSTGGKGTLTIGGG